MAKRLILPLAFIGWVVSLWTMFGWGVGVGVGLITLIAVHEKKVARSNQEWRERWTARENLWDAGDRRVP